MNIAFEDLEKTYPDGTRALTGVRFDIPSGQFCVLLGPSGSGKSTLLRCVNGLVAPSGGAVRIGDTVLSPNSLNTLRRRMGTIHQHFALTPRASVAANIIAGALPAVSTPRALLSLFPRAYQQRACLLAEAVGLEERHLRRRASTLSGGQQQRVGIARAFMLDPRIILADEPVASLDPRISADILSIIAEQARRTGATVLCSLHQIDLARQFADRIVALKKGAIVFDGPPSTLADDRIERIYGAALGLGASEHALP